MIDRKTICLSFAALLGGFVLIILFSCLVVGITSPEEFLNEWHTSAARTARSQLEYDLLRDGFLPAEVEQCFVWALGSDWQTLEIRDTPDRWRALHPDEPVIRDEDDIRRGSAIIIGAWKRHQKDGLADPNYIVWAYESGEVCKMIGHKWEYGTHYDGVSYVRRVKYCPRCGEGNPEWVNAMNGRINKRDGR